MSLFEKACLVLTATGFFVLMTAASAFMLRGPLF